MKKALVIGILLVGISGQAMSMGHPHNLFAARKQMRAKVSALSIKPKAAASSCWNATVEVDKNTFGKRLVAALSQVRLVSTY